MVVEIDLVLTALVDCRMVEVGIGPNSYRIVDYCRVVVEIVLGCFEVVGY